MFGFIESGFEAVQVPLQAGGDLVVEGGCAAAVVQNGDDGEKPVNGVVRVEDFTITPR